MNSTGVGPGGCSEILLPTLEDKSIIGVGTGSTAQIVFNRRSGAPQRAFSDGAVASSDAQLPSELKAHGIPVYDLNSGHQLAYYVDGGRRNQPAP